MRTLRIISLALILVLLGLPLTAMPAYAAIADPDTLSIQSVEVHRSVLELNDQLYIIVGTVYYAAPPAGYTVEDTFIVRLMDGPAELGTGTFDPYQNDGFDTGYGVCSIYFRVADAPIWNASYTMKIQGNPTLAWTGGDPPSTETTAFSWNDEGSVAAARQTLTSRVRSIAQLVEDDWGGTTDLIELVAGVKKLTSEGETYFCASINNLRVICPDLFTDVMTSPTFDERGLVDDWNLGGEDADYDIYGTTWYAQTFTPTQAYSITGVEMRLFKVGIVAATNIVVTIEGVGGGGMPDGNTHATATMDANDFTENESGSWYYPTFTADYTLTAGTTYAIVAKVATGDNTHYVSWLANSGNRYAGGQACQKIGAGAWGGIADVDFVFVIHATGADAMSYRNKLANRLVGTQFDMTDLAADFNMSRMWMSSMIWILLACLMPTIFFCRAVQSYKPATLIFMVMLPFGALAGFMYLEVAILTAFLCASAMIYSFAYRGSP